MSQICGRVFDTSTYAWVADVAVSLVDEGYATIQYVDGSLATRDISINDLYLKDLNQEASINALILENIIQDTSIVANTLDILEVSTNKADISYVDASLNNKLDIGLAVLEASLGTSFVYDASENKWEVSVEAAVTQEYVDGSLAARDVSIDYLNKNKLSYLTTEGDGSTLIADSGSDPNEFFASLKSLEAINNVILTDDGSVLTIDGSNLASLSYVDGSLSTIQDLLTIHDTSIVTNQTDILFNSALIANKVDKSGDTMTGDLSINAYLHTQSVKLDIENKGPETEGTLNWNASDNTLDIVTGVGDTVIQAGQEVLYKVYNANSHTLLNGKVVHSTDTETFTDGYPHVEYANSKIFEQCSNQLGFVTGDILPGEVGFVTVIGKVRDADPIPGVSTGRIYLADDVSGNVTNTKPLFPSFALNLGGMNEEGDYIIAITDKIEDIKHNFYNGTFMEAFNFDVSTDGTTVWGSLFPKNGHPNMTMQLYEGLFRLDTDPDASINLNIGTQADPARNFVYIDSSTKELAVNSSDWPYTEEHIKVAILGIQDAATVNAYGAIRNQNINDPLQNYDTNQGHLSVMAERIRLENSKWYSGTEGSCQTDGTDVYVSVTGGQVYQMNRQSFDSFNTATGDHLFVFNNPSSQFTPVSNLNGQINDSNGATLNNTSFSFVLWGVINSGNSADQLLINLPSGSYAHNAPDDAVNDAFNYTDYSIPPELIGVGFLIARFTYTYKNGVWVLYETEDLRGKTPNSTAGGGGGGGTGVTTFLGLTDTPSAYTGNAGYIPLVNTGESALEFSNDYYGKTYIDGSLNVKADTTYVDAKDASKMDLIASETDFGNNGYWRMQYEGDYGIDSSIYTQFGKFGSIGNPYFNLAGPDPAIRFSKYDTGANGRTLKHDSDTYVDNNFPKQSTLDSSSGKADKNVGIVEKSTNYTLEASTAGWTIDCDASITITLPDNMAIGYQAIIVNSGTGYVSLDGSTLRSVDGSTMITDQYGMATAIHKGSGEYYIGGNLKDA